MGKMDEIIIAAPRVDVFENESLTFQGTLRDKETVDTILENINNSFVIVRRGDAEENENLKQPIPYAVIKRRNEIFVYERLKGAGETRLHNKLSLGVGGHMNQVIGAESLADVLSENLYREVQEELIIDGQIESIKTIGLINDDSDDVGKVHLGVLVVIELQDNAQVSVREVDELSGIWMTLKGLNNPKVYKLLENWSKIVVDIL